MIFMYQVVTYAVIVVLGLDFSFFQIDFAPSSFTTLKNIPLACWFVTLP